MGTGFGLGCLLQYHLIKMETIYFFFFLKVPKPKKINSQNNFLIFYTGSTSSSNSVKSTQIISLSIMNVAGSRAPTGRPKILTREDFEKNHSQQSGQKSSTSPSPTTSTTNSSASSPSSSSSAPATTTSGKRKPKSNKRSRKKRSADGIKLAIRLLPPNLQSDEFWEKISDLVNPQTTKGKYYIQGKYSNKPFKLPTYSRGYVIFKDSKALDEFVAKYKEVTFEDDRESMIPQFQLALFNKVPDSSRTYTKPKQTLEDMLSYKTFLKFFNGEIERPTSFLISGGGGERSDKDKDAKNEKKSTVSEKGEKKKRQRSKKSKDEKPKATVAKPEEKKVEGKKDKPKRQRKPRAKKEEGSGTDGKAGKPKEKVKERGSKPKEQKSNEQKTKDSKSKEQKSPAPKEPKQDPKPKLKIMKRVDSDPGSSNSKPKPMLLKRGE